VSFLYAAYQSFSSGGDVRALGIAGIKYLVPGPRVRELWLDLSRRQQHVQLPSPIDRKPRECTDMFSNWMTRCRRIWTRMETSPCGPPSGAPHRGIRYPADPRGLILMPITMRFFAPVLFALRSVLYVTGPLVLHCCRHIPGPTARTYLVNMLVFNPGGLLYAIFSCADVRFECEQRQ